MKIFLVLLSFIPLLSLSQDYWQQEVNYKIDVRLDDKNHLLRGYEEFEYINRSPFSLDSMYIHIWPNAYLDGKTALGKQNYENGNNVLKFGNDSLKGCIDSLNFKVNGIKVNWVYTTNRDIVLLVLNESLLPNDRITVSTPFKVNIPSGEISRLGHVGQSYQITQWYPKPAVFDKEGWHAFPYLTQGEFYSEFGSYDVKITLPENYVVGATGDLQTQSEVQFLTNLSESTKTKVTSSETLSTSNDFPLSSTTYKTIHYKQSRVHDFAWFADKRFMVLKGEVILPESKRKVNTWAMFTPKNHSLWRDAIEYINDGTYYYSLWNGDYPYNNVTAIDGTISAGGGMEYPNVTVIGNASSKKELEIVIVHEVGHNWFYGILGSNERDHGWMDEGLNTLNEIRYVQTKYPNNDNLSDMLFGGILHFDHLSHKDLADVSYRFVSRFGLDQNIETKSADFTSSNYGIIMYQKTGIVFYYLKDYLGDEMFDKAMRNYFNEWKFKHPQPADLKASLEKTTGKNLDWFFKDLIQTTNHIDYEIKKVKKNESGDIVYVKNVGQIPGPIPVSAMDGDSVLMTLWTEPGVKKSSLTFPATFDRYVIDPNQNISEIDRTNNIYDKSQTFKKLEPIKLQFATGYNQPNISNNYIFPAMGFNVYDKYMIGVAVHNISLPPNKFQYFIAPMYSFGRESVSGVAELMYTVLPKKIFELTQFGLSFKTFKNNRHPEVDESRNAYYAITPYIDFRFGKRGNKTPWENILLIQGLTNFIKGPFAVNTNLQYGVFAKYTLRYTKTDHRFSVILRQDYVESNYNSNINNFARLSSEAKYAYRYLKNKMSRWVEFRVSHTVNLRGKNLNAFPIALTGASGYQDLFFEEYFFDRQSFYLNGQQMENMGNFRTGVIQDFNKVVSTLNFTAQLPVKPNIFLLFADIGTGGNANITGNYTLYYNAGLGLHIGDFIAVYFPLYNSDNFNFGNTFFEDYLYKIRFTIKLNPVNRNFRIKL